MRIQLGFFLILFAIGFSACNNEQLIEPKAEVQCENMLYFDSFEEMNTELEKVMNMTYEERLVWEKSKGFTSIELEAERLYESIDFEQFESAEQVYEFIESNKDKLLIDVDEEGNKVITTVLSDNPFRFFANRENLFQIQNYICKIFDEGVVGIDQSRFIPEVMDNYIGATKQEESILIYTNDSKNLEKSVNPESCPIAQIEAILYDSRFKMHVISGSITNDGIVALPYIDWAITYYEPNWLGFWVKKETNIAYNINIQLKYMRLDGLIRQITEVKANYNGIYAKEVSGGELYPIFISPEYGTSLAYYNCWGKKVDSTFEISLYCNNI